jgi:glycosidase
VLAQSSLLHLPDQPFAYGVAPGVLRVVVRTPTGAVRAGQVRYNDRYAWAGSDYEPLREAAPLRRYACDGGSEYWAAELHLHRPRFRYRFGLETDDGTRWLGWDGLRDEPAPAGAFEYAYLWEGDTVDTPAWARGAVFYHVFPDRFARSARAAAIPGLEPWDAMPSRTSVYGGDLDGIVERLDHIASLGVDALYLTPIFTAPSNHRYDPSDQFEVDPRLGGMSALRRLVAALRERDMRILLDGVFNHVSRDWEPFRDVRRHGAASPFARWFRLDADRVADVDERRRGGQPDPARAAALGYETWGTDIPWMPKLRTSEQEVRDLACRVGRFWVQEFGVHGWRLDVANEVDPRLWRDFRRAVREVDPEAFLVGEIAHLALPWLRGDQLDSVMDYPLRTAILDLCGRGGSPRSFLDAVDRIRAAYPEPIHHVLYNLIGSHDEPRPLTECGGDRDAFAVAVATLFALPGAVSVYYGDEVGVEGGSDPDNRRPMPWGNGRDERILALHRRLGRMRRQMPALRQGSYERLADDGMAAFLRICGRQRVAVLVNAGREPQGVPDRVIAERLDGASRPPITLAYHEDEASLSRGTLHVPGRSVVFIPSEDRDT